MLVKSRKIFTRLHWYIPICSILSIFMLFAGCTDVFTSEQESLVPNYSGQELFRGIIFADGPVAEKIPEIKNHFLLKDLAGNKNFGNKEKVKKDESTKLKAIRKIQSDIITVIDKSNPTYFSNFAEIIKSGDHLLTNKIIGDSGPILLEAINEMPEIAQLKERSCIGA